MRKTIGVEELNEDMAFIFSNYQSSMSASYNKKYNLKSKIITNVIKDFDYKKARSVAYSSLNNSNGPKLEEDFDIRLIKRPFGRKLLDLFETIFNAFFLILKVIAILVVTIFALKLTLGLGYFAIKLVCSAFTICCSAYMLFKGVLD